MSGEIVFDWLTLDGLRMRKVIVELRVKAAI